MENKIPPIAEKIKFWEEQDKINQAIIPRIIELNESLKKCVEQVGKIDSKIANAESRVQNKLKEETSLSFISINSQLEELKAEQKLLKELFSSYEIKNKSFENEIFAKLEEIKFPNKYKILLLITFLFAFLSLFFTINV